MEGGKDLELASRTAFEIWWANTKLHAASMSVMVMHVGQCEPLDQLYPIFLPTDQWVLVAVRYRLSGDGALCCGH